MCLITVTCSVAGVFPWLAQSNQNSHVLRWPSLPFYTIAASIVLNASSHLIYRDVRSVTSVPFQSLLAPMADLSTSEITRKNPIEGSLSRLFQPSLDQFSDEGELLQPAPRLFLMCTGLKNLALILEQHGPCTQTRRAASPSEERQP